MLSIGRVGPAGADYYIDQVARGAEDYYLGAGEAPGRWVGSGIGSLGLDGQVDETAFRRVLDGCHPATAERLVAGSGKRLSGLDLTFSAPKSVSLLWGLHPDPAVRAVVADAHRWAVADGLEYLEGEALFARRGRNGRQRVTVKGLVAAGFEHRSSRAGDPQLHTHVVAANLVADHAARWSAPDSRAIFRHARTAGFVYQARLRHHLATRLGIQWGPVRNGQADIAAVDRTTIEGFSARRAQITASLDRRGMSTANAARVAALATRPAKTDQPGLVERWQQAALDSGVKVEGLVGPARTATLGPVAESRLIDTLLGAEGLTAHSSVFDRRAVFQALAAAPPDGATVEALREIAERLLADSRVVALGTPGSAGRPEGRWTTVELLAVEADVVASAARARDTGVGMADLSALSDALAARPQLSFEQADLVGGICRDRSGVVTVVGKAGAGKTFALDAARDAWQTSGITVIGAAVAARAAAELQAGSGIPSTTLTRLLADLERPEGRLAAGSVIVIDEAGTVGTRDLHRLLTLAAEQRARVVLVGDPAQLPEIAAGGAFTRLTTQGPCFTLAANRRQIEAWERDALDLLREKQPAPALARYGTHGRVTIADTAADLRDQMVADWHHAHSRGDTAVMLAVRRADVGDLNTRAQAARVAAEELDPTSSMTVGDRQFMVGDEIVCARNDHRAGLTNGTRATITHLDPQEHGMTARDPAGDTVEIPGGYVDAGHVGLGYALTVHKSQGATFDRAFLLGDDRLFAEAGYVGLSRGRQANHLYVVAGTEPLRAIGGQPGDGLIEHVCAALGVSRAQTLSTAAVRDRPPDAPLSQLVAERDRLSETLLGSMPRRPRIELAGTPLPSERIGERVTARDEWTMGHRRDGERLARLTAAVERRVHHLGVAALADPPEHLTRLLGAPPDDRWDRRDWAQTAAAVEAWREVTGRSATRGSRHLLTEPDQLRPEHQWWASAARAVEHYQTRHHPLGVGRADDGLDRSWQPDVERGLER